MAWKIEIALAFLLLISGWLLVATFIFAAFGAVLVSAGSALAIIGANGSASHVAR